MSSENVEILRRADEAFKRGDLTAALVDMDEHITASRVAPMPDGAGLPSEVGKEANRNEGPR